MKNYKRYMLTSLLGIVPDFK